MMIELHGAAIHVEVTGEGPETILFIHGLMLASESFEAQREAFSRTHRVITFDLRGQGRSAKTLDRLDLDSLAEDAAALIERFGGGRCHVVGFSMGAFIAMRVAARSPKMVRSLTLIGPSAEAESLRKMPGYTALILAVRLLGPRLFAGSLLRILFGRTFLAAAEHAPARDRYMHMLAELPRSLSRAASASARRGSIAHELAAIKAPTLVVSGEEDRPIPPATARRVCAGIAGARFHSFARTGHAVMIERPAAFNAALGDFLRTVGSQSEP